MQEHTVPRGDMTRFLYYALSGPAYTFFYDEIYGKAMPISAAFDMLQERFLSQTRLVQIRQELLNLRLSQFQIDGCSKTESLERARAKIVALTRHGDPQYRGDAHMSDILQSSVLRDEQWSVSA